VAVALSIGEEVAMRISKRQYEQLLTFRTSLRAFLRWSEDQARAAGITPSQHQLLLAIKGHPDGNPTVGELAEHLLLRHHSTVELLDRTQLAGYAVRLADPADGRVVRVGLTTAGEEKLEQLTSLTLAEIQRLSPLLAAITATAPPRSGA
jgi:DNA-binding MarR family transcriptional regulator